MPSNSDKCIRSLKDNPAGKVIADPEGDRFEWEAQDDTSLLLKKLNNDDLAIEKTDSYATPERAGNQAPPHRNASPRAAP